MEKQKEKQKVIDFHTHIYPDKVADRAIGTVSRFYNVPMMGNGTVEDMKNGAQNYDVLGYAALFVATSPAHVKGTNSFAKSIVAPDIFVFGSLHPEYERNLEQIDNMINAGVTGIKLHPDFQQFNLDTSAMFPVYEKLEALGLPLLMHMGDERYDFSRPHRLARVLDSFPKLRVIAAHMGGYSAWNEVKHFLAGRDLYFDTSSSLWSLGIEGCTELIQLHGADKIVFGTDYPLTTIDKEMLLFDMLDLSENDRQKILYKNAAGILGIALGSPATVCT